MKQGEDVLISDAGSSRGSGYIESNKIVGTAGKVHVAWLDAGRGGREPVRIRTQDQATGIWAPPVTLGEAEDNHGGPALVRDGHGFLHTLFGPHHGPFVYRRSIKPDDSTGWTAPETFGHGCTYPSLVCDADNTLHLVCRDSSPELGLHLAYYRRRADGEWSPGRPLIESTVKHGEDGYRCYRASLFPDVKGRLHLAFMLFGGEHFQDARNTGLAGYLRSDDGGESWTHADGTLVRRLPTDRDFDRVPVTANCIRTSNLVLDSEAVPCLVTVSTGFRGYADKWGEALLWRRKVDGWKRTPLNAFIDQAYPGYRASWCEPSLSVDADGRLVVALVAIDAAQVDPTGTWHGGTTSIYAHPSSRIVMLTIADGGRAIDAFPVGRDVPGIPSWIPSVERFTGHNDIQFPRILYTHGLSGGGCKPEAAVCEIRMITPGST